MSPRFVGERIDVETEGTVKQPVALIWRGRRHGVTEVIAAWFDWGFSPAATQKNWRTRRHRNYFRVKLDNGDVCEIYLDRPPSSAEGEWFLYQILD